MSKSPWFNRSKKRSKVLSFLLAFVIAFFPMALNFPTSVQAATTLKTYPAPSGVTLNTAYTVKVRVPGGNWQDLDEYRATVDNYHPHNLSFVNFDTDGPVEMSVTFNTGTITSAIIRPTNKNITPTINGNTMTFSISGPMNLSAMVNGDEYNTLDIFANPVEVNPPSPNDPNVIYVGPGYYTQDYIVPSGKTLYIAGGAAIKGEVILDNATNAKVMGRGVLDRPPGRAVSANYANQITVEGIILNDYGDGNNGGNAVHMAGSTNVTIDNVKAYSYKKWTDGIDTFNASYITINNIFMRTADDAIAIYGSRANGGSVYSGLYSSHISVTNSILTPDTAHPINIGTHGDPTLPGGGGTIDTLSFSNLDIWSYHQALPISVTASDALLVTDVTFTDIRIDDHAPGRIADVLTYKSGGYGLAPGRGVNNVYFKDIAYTGSNGNSSQIYGYDSSRLTQNVTFENLQVNGTVITSASQGNFSLGNYINNINFIATGGSVPAPKAIPHYAPTNLALNKTASSDSSQAGNPASGGNDGSTTTRWSANDGNTGHSWTVDLGTIMNITDGTQVMWEKSGVAYQYKIETSNDNTNWTLKSDNTGNTDTSQVQSDLFLDFARYVRITVTGLPSGAWASFYDFKVFGEPLNLALGKTASSDSTQAGSPASNGNDGNPSTLWSANDGNTGHSFMVDLGYVKNIAYGTQVMWPNSGAAYQYKIETSSDNVNWTLKVDKTGNTDTNQVQNDYFTGYARYVRITVTGLPSGAWASFYDFKVFGDLVNLARGKNASADNSLSGNPASNGTDDNTTTRWSASNATPGHWWKVDLGASRNITGGTQVMWEKIGKPYQYKIETSSDNINWTVNIDKTGNGSASQVQNDYFIGTARYVKITVTGVPSGATASFYDFKVFGETGDTLTMARLPFDEISGTMAYDATSNGWNGTLVGGASQVAGKYGNAVSLNGTNQYVALPSGVVSGDTAITVTALVYLNSASNGTRIFDFGSGTNTYMFLTPKNAVNGKIRFGITTSGNTHEQDIDGTAPLTTGVWHHVAVTLNGSTGTLYVDGQQVGSNTGMTIKPSDLGVTTQNWIGRSQYSSDPYLDGLVDDFRIYNAALPAADIIIAPNETVELTAKQAITYQVKATDPTGATLIYSAAKLPSGAAFDAAAGIFTWTPTLTNHGDNDVTFTVSNGLYEVSQTVDFKVNLNILPPNDYTKGSYFLYQQEVERILAAIALPNADKAALAADLAKAEGLLVRVPLSVYSFEGNANNSFGTATGTVSGTASYTTGKIGQAISLNGKDSYVTLPAAHPLSTYNEITLSTWVYWKGGNAWQRIFDFGNGTSQYLFLTPRSGSNTLRFAIKNGGGEQIVETSQLAANQWAHVAVTLGGGTAKLYVNGELKATKTDFTIKPSDLKATLNYLGKSQFPSDPLFNGMMDEFRVYDHVLTIDEIKAVYNNTAKWTDNSLVTLFLGKAAALDSKLYTETSWQELAAAVANAQALAADAAQDAIDAAAAQLLSVLEGLNAIPVFAPLSARTVEAGTSVTFAVYATDPDGDALTYSAGSLPDGATFDPQSGQFAWSPKAPGNYGVTFNVYDSRGATASTLIGIQVVDTIPPTTTDDAPINWVKHDVAVNLTATDSGSGVAATYYTIDGGVQQTGTTVNVVGEGTHSLVYSSVDNAGNVEQPHTVAVIIDKTAPVTAASVHPEAPDGSNGWYEHAVTVSFRVYDNLSGAAKTEYSLDGGSTWLTYMAPVTLSQDSKYTLSYRSTDIAGNVEAAKTISFNLDQTAPTITVSGLVYGTYSDSMDITPILTLSDNLSGVDSSKTTVTLDTYGVQQGATIPLYTLPLGSHMLIVTASDLAGNTSSQTIAFQTTASIQSLQALVTRFTNMGWIDNAGIANSLQSKLTTNSLADFVSEVQAQSGKHISAQAAGYLLRDARYLLSKH